MHQNVVYTHPTLTDDGSAEFRHTKPKWCHNNINFYEKLFIRMRHTRNAGKYIYMMKWNEMRDAIIIHFWRANYDFPFTFRCSCGQSRSVFYCIWILDDFSSFFFWLLSLLMHGKVWLVFWLAFFLPFKDAEALSGWFFFAIGYCSSSHFFSGLQKRNCNSALEKNKLENLLAAIDCCSVEHLQKPSEEV